MSEAAGEPATPRAGLRDRTTFALVVAGTFGLQALTMVTGIVTARILGVEGRGVVALVFALGLFASQLTFGGSLPVALTKNIAARRVATRDAVRGLVRRYGWLILLPCGVAAGLMAWLSRADPAVLALAACVFVMALQTILTRLLLAGLQGEIDHLGRMVAVALLPQALFAATLTVVWAAGWSWSAVEVLIAFFVVSALGHGAGWLALARPRRAAADRLETGALWRDTRTSYVSAVRPLDSLGLDRILVGGLLGTVALGLYAAAVAVANLCGTIGNAVAVIVLPRIAQHAGDPAAQRALAKRWLGFTLILVTAVVAILQAVLEPLIVLAFGEEFSAAVEVARWLVIADGFFAVRKVLIAALQGQGRGGTASWIELALTPLLVLGLVIAGAADDLVLAAVGILVVAALSCVALGTAVLQHVKPPSTTTT